jgi:hypothetical protein
LHRPRPFPEREREREREVRERESERERERPIRDRVEIITAARVYSAVKNICKKKT